MVDISPKAARVNANLTQKAAAKKLNISKQTLANYETGTTIPTINMGKKMAELYNIPVDMMRFGRK